MDEFFKMLMIGYVKHDFQKRHGRMPEYGEIPYISIGGVKVALTEEDFKSTADDDLRRCGFVREEEQHGQ